MVANPIGLKKRILIPLVAAGTAVAIVGYYFLSNIDYRQKHGAVYQEAIAMQKHLKSALEYKAETMGANLSFIVQNRALIAALKASDRSKLLQLGASIYARLNREHDITHFYFHSPERVNIARIHKPDRFGDSIHRFTAIGAEKEKRLFSGIELGPLGTFTLRSVLPVVEDGNLLGYIELGQEIDAILDETHRAFNVQLFLLIHKRYLNRDRWEEGMRMLSRSFDWDMFPESVMISQSVADAPNDYLAAINADDHTDDAEILDTIEFNDKNYWAGVLPVLDAGDREVAHLVFLHDMTELREESKNELIWFMLLSTLISWIIFIFFYRVLGSTEQDLMSARQQLIEASEARMREVEETLNIQRVLDEMLNISLPPLTMKEVMQKSLDAVLSIPAFALRNQGSIFLANEKGDHLEMIADRNLPDILMQSCSLLPLGKCLCGKAAANREIVYQNHLNDLHEIQYDGMQPHGHYCIPVLSEGRLLGVLNAYIEPGHERNKTEEGFLKNVADTLAVVIERKQAEEQLKKMAHFDNLTGLPNRSLFQDRLDQVLALSKRHKDEFAVLFLDLDHFKEVNDTLGHDAGDDLLSHAASRLLSCVRKSDTVARMGGDEFTVIVSEANAEGSVEYVARHIIESLIKPFELNGTQCQVGTSIGIAVYPHDGRDGETLLKHADIAMYEAKKERNTYRYFKDLSS